MKHLELKPIGLLVILGLVLSFACGGKITTRPTTPKYKFTVNGVVVKDLSLSKDIAYFTILRDSVAFDSAVVKVGQNTLESHPGGIYSKKVSHLFDFGDTVTITVLSTKDSFSVNFNLFIPGSFHITDITNIADRTVHSQDKPRVLFTTSANASGYFISVLKKNNTEGANGLNTLIPWEGIGGYTITGTTFRDVYDNYITGTYLIYLVAYNKSFLAYPDMKFQLPTGLPKENISGANGTIGAGVVAAPDSIKAE
ncbi:MAG: hypothetical protein WCE90_06290 [Candidatus Zixiibacteriota bacterium]